MTTKKPHVSLIRGPIVFGDGAINNEATPAIAFAFLSGYLRKRLFRQVNDRLLQTHYHRRSLPI